MRQSMLLAAGLSVALFASGCAGQPAVSTGASGAATQAASTALASPTVSPTMTGSPVTQTPTPASPSPTPTPAGVVLAGTGVAGYAFGSQASSVEPVLRSRLGKPGRVTEDTGCPMNQRWTRSLSWKGLFVSFEAATAKKTTKVKLTTWELRPTNGVPAGVTLAGNLPLTPTFAQLKAAFPGTKVTEELGWFFLKVPSGVTYIGESKTRPSAIHGGPIQWCE